MMFMAKWLFPPMGLFLLLMAVGMGRNVACIPVVTARAIGLMVFTGVIALITSALAWTERGTRC